MRRIATAAQGHEIEQGGIGQLRRSHVGHCTCDLFNAPRMVLVPLLEHQADLPTLQEAGLEGFEMTVWHGMFAPAGTPPEILEKLSGALQTALQDPKVIERFAQLGTTPVPVEEATPAALDAHLAAEIAKWKSVVAKAGEFAD